MIGAAGAEPLAQPAPREQVDACGREVAAARPTQNVRQRVHDVVGLGGCIADGGSGIAHAFLAWSSESEDRTGRICTDPSILDGLWQCSWDTSTMPPGDYTVTFVAIDDAGNRGTFDRPYQITKAQAERAPATGTTTDDPRMDNRNAVINLALERMDACTRDGVQDAPTSDPNSVSQVQQANMVAACIEPALEALGASSVIVDALPVPPVVVIQVARREDIDRLAPVLPATVAGVPVAIELSCARNEANPCQQA